MRTRRVGMLDETTEEIILQNASDEDRRYCFFMDSEFATQSHQQSVRRPDVGADSVAATNYRLPVV